MLLPSIRSGLVDVLSGEKRMKIMVVVQPLLLVARLGVIQVDMIFPRDISGDNNSSSRVHISYIK